MPPTLTTDRLTLTPATAADAAELHQLWALPAVRRYLCDDCILPLSQIQEMVAQSMAAFAENRYGLWMARLKGELPIVGFTGYWPFFEPPQVELVYGLAPDYWGRGLATEMARAMIPYGFDTLKLAAVRASADRPNTASIAVMKRLGMTFTQEEVINNQPLVFYTLPNPP